MYEYAVIWDWLGFAARWLHVITAIAWIGSSFYFIALDLGLRKSTNLPKGASGEEWQVHGGGFYHIQKYLVAPQQMPEHLTWFKWESYATWLSGFVLLSIVYYAGADLYLVDPNVLDISATSAILISLGSMVIGWLVYDQICKSPLGNNNTTLMVFLYLVLVATAYGYTQVFTGRAALLHLGIFTATLMSGNVIFIIIPNQNIVVADLIAGRQPDAKYGVIAKQRSTHNNYLTLPVLFLMLSVHYPLAFATGYNWIIASLVFLMGVSIRHYFNSRHGRTSNPTWTWLLTAILFIIIMWLSSIGPINPQSADRGAAALTSRQQSFASNAEFGKVRDLVQERCSMCHAQEPVWPGMITAPKGVMLESDAQIAARAREIYLHAGFSRAMPPPNAIKSGVGLEPDERQLLVEWYKGVVGAT